MSTIATSGRWWRTAASSSSAVPAWATTSNPASTSSRAMPSRRRTESSARTTAGSRGVQQGPDRVAGQLFLRDEAEGAARPSAGPERGWPRGSRSARRAVAARRARARGRPRSLRRRAARCRAGRGPGGGRARPQAGGAVACLADHDEPVGLEQRARLGPEAGVVVDDEDGGHSRRSCHAPATPLQGYPGKRRAKRSESGPGAACRRRSG